MPYFIFKIKPAPPPVNKQLELLDEMEKFKEAKKHVRTLRAENEQPDLEFKIIYADSVLDAEEKLMEVREPPILAEWEK